MAERYVIIGLMSVGIIVMVLWLIGKMQRIGGRGVGSIIIQILIVGAIILGIITALDNGFAGLPTIHIKPPTRQGLAPGVEQQRALEAAKRRCEKGEVSFSEVKNGYYYYVCETRTTRKKIRVRQEGLGY